MSELLSGFGAETTHCENTWEAGEQVSKRLFSSSEPESYATTTLDTSLDEITSCKKGKETVADVFTALQQMPLRASRCKVIDTEQTPTRRSSFFSSFHLN